MPIETIAERAGLLPDEVEPYGRYKAKVVAVGDSTACATSPTARSSASPG